MSFLRTALRLICIAAVFVGAVAASTPAHASFPGRAGKIAFGSDRDGNREIYVMNADGSNQVNLTNSPADDRWPAWSPDGQQIAFTSTRDGNEEIYKMNADGTGQTRLTVDPASDRLPTWTSDGRIVFDRGADVSPFVCTGSRDLYIMNADGTGVSNLTNNAAEDCAANVSANGRIAFMSSRDDPNFEIYTINLDGGGLARLTITPCLDQAPNWAPSGTRIAFLRDCSGQNDIWVMRADGTDQTRLTDTPTREESWMTWSPQEDKIAFTGGNQIYVMNAAGGSEAQLTSAGSNTRPDWQPLPKTNQAITFDPLAAKTYGDPDFSVSASASSGLPVSFTAAGSCTVSGITAHITGAGSCTITASQAGDANYSAAASVSQSFVIAKANQTITFGALASKTYGAADFDASASTSSGLPVTFAASGSCRVSGVTVHITGVGVCKVTASQGGDSNYNPAPVVSQSFTISPQPCRVPKVVGKKLAAAKLALKQRHCGAGKVSYAYSKKTQKGKVSAQSRRSGQVLRAGTKVNLVVSRGPRR